MPTFPHTFATLALLAAPVVFAAPKKPAAPQEFTEAVTKTAGDFFAAPVDPGAKLPADKFYPQGRRMVFAGYSGVPKRDLENGFTVGGPFYGSGNERETLAAIAAKRPCLAQVGVRNTENLKAVEALAKLSDEETRAQISAQVKRFVDAESAAKTASVVWWCIQPEELRPWKSDEMRYLRVAAETIRETDPRKRPVFLYNPNHRDAGTLTPIAAQVDILAKGCYVNSVGRKEERGWIRHTVGQMRLAGQAAGRPDCVVVMPELCKDPEPGETGMIAAWARHDTYLGLMAGSKGVLIWSLFPRGGVKVTWKNWYDAYARVGRELNGKGGLAPVFLFGERRDDIRVAPVENRPAGSSVRAKNGLEDNTSKADEGARAVVYPWTKTEVAYGGARYVFIANSYPGETSFRVAGIPAGAKVVSAFTGEPVKEARSGAFMTLKLAPWEVVALKLSAR